MKEKCSENIFEVKSATGMSCVFFSDTTDADFTTDCRGCIKIIQTCILIHTSKIITSRVKSLAIGQNNWS